MRFCAEVQLLPGLRFLRFGLGQLALPPLPCAATAVSYSAFFWS